MHIQLLFYVSGSMLYSVLYLPFTTKKIKASFFNAKKIMKTGYKKNQRSMGWSFTDKL